VHRRRNLFCGVRLICFYDLFEIERGKAGTIGFVELILKLNPVKAKSVQKTLKKVHREKDGGCDNLVTLIQH